jgi:hypothetical protein
MQLKQDLAFLVERFPLMCRADQLTILGLVNSRAIAHQGSIELLSANLAASKIVARPAALASL